METECPPPFSQHHGTHPAHLSKFNNLPHLSDSPPSHLRGLYLSPPEQVGLNPTSALISIHMVTEHQSSTQWSPPPRVLHRWLFLPVWLPWPERRGQVIRQRKEPPFPGRTLHTLAAFIWKAAPSYILQKKLSGEKSPGQGLSSTGESAFQAHPAMSGDISVCHNRGRRVGQLLASSRWKLGVLQSTDSSHCKEASSATCQWYMENAAPAGSPVRSEPSA